MVALMIGAAACGSAGSDKSIETAATANVASSTPLASSTTSELTEDEATGMAETIIAAWNADDVSTIEEMLGPTGVYIAINGDEFDASRVHKWLDPMLPVEAALGATSRTGDPVAVTDGFYFPLVGESGHKVFFLVITRSTGGVLTIHESSHVPLADG